MPDLAALSRSIHPPPDFCPPTRFERLFPYQQAALAQDPLRKHMLLAHAPGAGKTPIALALLRTQRTFLVVCPPTITDQWATKAQEWCGMGIPVLRTGAEAFKIHRGQSAIVADSLVHKIPSDVHFDALVVDEVHRMKTRDARRTKMVFGGENRGYSFPGIADRCDRVFALTGTPLQNSPVDLYPFLAVCAPGLAMSFEQYTQRYCPPVEQRVPNSPFPVKRYDLNLQNLDELALKLRESVMIRPSAAECLAQLPPVIEDVYRIDNLLDPAEGISEDQLAALFDGQPSQVEPVAASQLRRESGLAKAHSNQLISWLHDLVDSGENPLIWCWHREVADFIAGKLQAGVVHGGVSIPDRNATIARYKAGTLPALVLTIAAAGTGLDGLQQSGSLAIFVEESYVPGDNEQAVGRLHRQGQTRGVRVVRVRTSLTVDRAIRTVLARKISMIRDVLT